MNSKCPRVYSVDIPLSVGIGIFPEGGTPERQLYSIWCLPFKLQTANGGAQSVQWGTLIIILDAPLSLVLRYPILVSQPLQSSPHRLSPSSSGPIECCYPEWPQRPSLVKAMLTLPWSLCAFSPSWVPSYWPHPHIHTCECILPAIRCENPSGCSYHS